MKKKLTNQAWHIFWILANFDFLFLYKSFPNSPNSKNDNLLWEYYPFFFGKMIENSKCSSTPNFPHNPQQPQSYILAVMRLIRMAQCWVGCRDDTTEIRGGSCQWSGGCYGMLSLRSLSELRDPGMVWTKQPPVLSSYLISHISYLIWFLMRQQESY